MLRCPFCRRRLRLAALRRALVAIRTRARVAIEAEYRPWVLFTASWGAPPEMTETSACVERAQLRARERRIEEGAASRRSRKASRTASSSSRSRRAPSSAHRTERDAMV
eukprot:5022957-Pleurochrysis_carterae.AAC.1